MSIIAVYGKVNAGREESMEEWEEITAQFRLAKARGDMVVCAGDFNRQVGSAIPGNATRADVGGRVVQAELPSADR